MYQQHNHHRHHSNHHYYHHHQHHYNSSHVTMNKSNHMIKIQCVYIPDDSSIDVNEIKIEVDNMEQIKRILHTQSNIIKRTISKRDESFFYLIDDKDIGGNGHELKAVNERATLLTRPRKEIYGKCILVHKCHDNESKNNNNNTINNNNNNNNKNKNKSSNNQSTFEPLTTLKFKRLIEVMSSNYPIFDFKNNTNTSSFVDLISTILYKNDFTFPQDNEEWTFQKTPQSILNELHTIKKIPHFQPLKYEFPPGQLFACYCEVEGKVGFASAKSNQLKKAQGNLALKILRYYLMLQNSYLHQIPFTMNDNSYEDFQKEIKEIESNSNQSTKTKKILIYGHFALPKSSINPPIVQQLGDGLEKIIYRMGNKDIKLSNYTRLKAQVTIYLLEDPGRIRKSIFLKRIKLSDLESGDIGGQDYNLPIFSKILPTMSSGEGCAIKVPPNYGYGDKGSPSDNIPPSSTLMMHIDCKSLKHFHTIQEAHQLPIEKKIELIQEYLAWAATKLRLYFYEKCALLYTQALTFYKSIIDSDEYLNNKEDESLQQNLRQLGIKLYTNIAIVYAKMGEWQISRDNCTLSLELLPTYKAYFWRAKAYHHLGDLLLAIQDIGHAITILDKEKQLIIQHPNDNKEDDGGDIGNTKQQENIDLQRDKELLYVYDDEAMETVLKRRSKILDSILSIYSSGEE